VLAEPPAPSAFRTYFRRLPVVVMMSFPCFTPRRQDGRRAHFFAAWGAPLFPLSKQDLADHDFLIGRN
jgi:hypothetical protein